MVEYMENLSGSYSTFGLDPSSSVMYLLGVELRRAALLPPHLRLFLVLTPVTELVPDAVRQSFFWVSLSSNASVKSAPSAKTEKERGRGEEKGLGSKTERQTERGAGRGEDDGLTDDGIVEVAQSQHDASQDGVGEVGLDKDAPVHERVAHVGPGEVHPGSHELRRVGGEKGGRESVDPPGEGGGAALSRTRDVCVFSWGSPHNLQSSLTFIM